MIEHEIRTNLGKCARVTWRIELRNDIHAHSTAVKDKVSEFRFRVIHIFIGQIGFVQSAVSAFLDIRFQTESSVSQIACFFRVFIVFIEDQVIIQMNGKIIHLIICHFLNDKLQCFHRSRLTRYVKHKATYFKFRIVTRNSFRHRAVILFEDLQNRAGRPICTCSLLSLDRHIIADLHEIPLFIQHALCIRDKIEISCLRRTVFDDFHRHAALISIIRLQCLCCGCCDVRCVCIDHDT